MLITLLHYCYGVQLNINTCLNVTVEKDGRQREVGAAERKVILINHADVIVIRKI